MAKRFTDTDVWEKDWFMRLSPKLKCLVSLVRDKCDIAGIWSPNWIIACAYIGENVTEDELLNIDNGKQFVRLENGKIYVIGFSKFQYGELKNSPVHKRVKALLIANKAIHLVEVSAQVEKETIQEREEKFKNKVFETLREYFATDSEELTKFISYWTESSGRTLRFEAEKYFDIKKRFSTWKRNSVTFKKQNNNDSKISGKELFSEAMRHAADH